MSNIAFVLGNGESRRGIEIDDLMEKGTVFACNGVYRTHRPHFLIAVDPKMIHEIAETDYMLHNKVWSNFNEQYRKNQKIMDFVQWFKPSLGWSSGPTALRMACEQGFKEIYILGFDYQGHKDGQRFTLNNIFGDTRNYKRKKDEATFFGNWMNQTKRCLKDFPGVKFHRVIPEGWFKPKDLEWAGNIDHPTTEELLAKFDLQIKK
ncbi:MAG: hypothetical protein CBC01_08165 [Betaproteobacteria bacterium TMED41]|nr:MAG: hypothetical protein CBC01_08165 [Betaproteobacteria bacterium TMED41]|tara:strand:- start:88 stop:705 length:618 start_codon:yes stop_codon:yes gene_type:complete